MPTQLAHPSPKRKRDQAPAVPLLNTALRLATPPPRRFSPPISHPDSPRNEVADRLGGMSLTSASAIPMSPLTPTDDVIRKKPKLDEMRVDSVLSLHTHVADRNPCLHQHSESLHGLAVKSPEEDAREIPETPQMVQPRMHPDIASFSQQHTTFTSSPLHTSGAPSHSLPQGKTVANDWSSSGPRPLDRSPSPPLSALTWKDSEITGHLADPSTDPDDDGTGINGIGFKPTPALAYARSQKRRQQINEWKARETREARAKRSERRRRGVGGMSSREVTVERDLSPIKKVEACRRSVKFAI